MGTGANKIDWCQAEIERIRKRHERFGEDVTAESEAKIKYLEQRIKKAKNFEKPEEIKDGAEIIEDSLYLYGTDFMSTNDIKEYMSTQFPELDIKWINDSSCTLKFKSKEDA